MPQFKIGDRVKLTAITHGDLRQPVALGDLGMVEGPMIGAACWLWVRFDGQPEALRVYADEISLVDGAA